MKQSRNRGRGANSRRRGNTPSVICLSQAKPPLTPPRKEPEAVRAIALPRNKEPLARTSQDDGAMAPLPRNRTLVAAPQKGLVALKAWLRKLVMKPKKAALTIDRASAKTQVRALRVEVAQLQRSLDQLMAQLRAAERS